MNSGIKRKLVLTARNVLQSILYCCHRCCFIPKNIKRVVFVCNGNICRSVFAEYVLRSVLKGSVMSVDSCGLNVGVSSHSPPEAVIVSQKFRVNLSGHFSKGWENCDLENADLILAMEYWQYRKLIRFLPHKKDNIFLLRELTPFPENLFCNINDPYGRSEEEFESCFSQINRAIVGIVNLL